MQNIDFPLFKTKIENSPEFDLADVEERTKYFELKAGKEIRKLRSYLQKNTFIAYLLGKKNSGKGTYAKMFKEVVDADRIEHISIGDVVRETDGELKDKQKREELLNFLRKDYRGYMSLDEILDSLENRSTAKLLPSELVLSLAKRKISQKGKKALFIDGFPRELDQISYSLFFRDLIEYRNDPDIFVLIDVPERVIDERIKYRVVCPLCQTSRNLKLLPTKKVEEENGKFYLLCDNSECEGARMVSKEGDELGIEPIKERLELDEKLMNQAFSLYGVPKILLRNCVPADKAGEYLDKYEITPEYVYRIKGNRVETAEKPWQIEDGKGILSYSLMPPPVVVSLIKQLAATLGI